MRQAGHGQAFGLPEWVPVEPCPRLHLDARITALDGTRLHAEATMPTLEQATPGGGRPQARPVAWPVRGRAVQGHLRVGHGPSWGLEKWYRVGQLIGYPAPLVENARAASPRQGRGKGPFARTSLPGKPESDPWTMTDPHSVPSLYWDPQARRVIDEMWTLDPDLGASVALRDEIRRAVETGGGGEGQTGQPIGFYFCTPYCAIFEAKRPLVVGNTLLRKGQRFTFERAAEGVRLGHPYKREIVVGNFQAGGRHRRP